jgi:hypothetical protein
MTSRRRFDGRRETTVVGVLSYEINWQAIVKIALLEQAQLRWNFLPSGRNRIDFLHGDKIRIETTRLDKP